MLTGMALIIRLLNNISALPYCKGCVIVLIVLVLILVLIIMVVVVVMMMKMTMML